MNITRVLVVVLGLGAAGTASAGDWEDWRYWIGVHDFSVDDVDSHTYGAFGGMSFDKTWKGRHVVGSADVFADRDKDELDPDHIPIRWDVHLGSDGEFWKGAHTHLGWRADVDTRMNTVSSIEREITALPSIVGWYESDLVKTSLKTGAGWFFLEIDDDVPKTRGYDRSDFRNSTLGYSVAADLSIRLGAHCRVVGEAQEWWDDDAWLQTQFGAAFHIDAGQWKKGSEVVLSADAYEYNLDVYQRPGEPAILPWNNDLLIRLSFNTHM